MDLKLKNEDYFELERATNLTSRHIDYALALLRRQFPDVKGLSSTFQDGNKVAFKSQIDRNYKTVQIHHLNHRNNEYWVASGSYPDEDEIYVYDPYLLPSSEDEIVLPQDIEIQLSQIYKSLGVLTILLPKLSFQAHSANSGLYAIGCALEFCMNNDPSVSKFTEMKLRKHVADCFNAGWLKPFPQTRLRTTPAKKSFIIPLICDCHRPAQYDQKLFGCRKCRNWFHALCYINCNKENWTCKSCELKGQMPMGDQSTQKCSS